MKCASAVPEHHLTKLIVRPLARRIEQQRRECIQQGKRIINKIQEVNKSVEIIARQVARWTRRSK